MFIQAIGNWLSLLKLLIMKEISGICILLLIAVAFTFYAVKAPHTFFPIACLVSFFIGLVAAKTLTK